MPLSLFAIAFLFSRPLPAQDVRSSAGRAEQNTETYASQAYDGASQAPDIAQSEPEPKKGETKKSAHRGSIIAAPFPIVSPTLGSGVIPVLGYIFPLMEKDKISRPSIIGGAALITNDGTSGFGLGAELFMKENRYQVEAIYADGNLSYNLYGIGIAAGNAGLKIATDRNGPRILRGSDAPSGMEVLRCPPRLDWNITRDPSGRLMAKRLHSHPTSGCTIPVMTTSGSKMRSHFKYSGEPVFRK